MSDDIKRRNALPYYKRYPRDFIEGTLQMSFEVKGAYSILLDLIYMQMGSLPDNPQYIAGLLGTSVRKWNLIRSELIDMGKISAISGLLTNYRADKELISLGSFQDKQSQNAGGARNNKGLAKPWHKPKTNHSEPDSEVRSLLRKESSTDQDEIAWWNEFWQLFPNKVGKPVACKAFLKAVKRTDRDAMIEGLQRYVNKTDDRPWCNPSTWLNQDRWADQPAQAQRGATPQRQTHNSVFDELRGMIDERTEFEEAPGTARTIDGQLAGPIRR